jgi:ribosome-binding factor A
VSERVARLDQLLQEEISAVLAREVHDPRIGFVTVTDVDVAPDLRHATVWVSVIGPEEERRETVRALGRAMPFVRGRLGRLRLKRIPELHLRVDDSVERGARVLRLIDELERGDGTEVGPAPDPLPAPGGRGQGEAVLPPPEPRRRDPRDRRGRPSSSRRGTRR